VISSDELMIINSGIVFDCHLVITPLAVFLLSFFNCRCQEEKKKKKRKKERKKEDV
jgi:hypothetical protein